MRKFKTYALVLLFLALVSCDDSCYHQFIAEMDAIGRIVMAGMQKDVSSTRVNSPASPATQGNTVDDMKWAGKSLPSSAIPKLRLASTAGPVYAVSSTANAVFVLDPSTLGLITKIAIGNGPTRAAIGTDNATLYVTNKQSDTISIIDMTSNTAKAPIALTAGSRPTGIAATDTSLFVINSALNSISQVDLATQKVTATFTGGSGPQAIATTPDGLLLYVANADNTVTVFDVLTNEVVKTVTGIQNPTSIGFTRDGTLAYVTSGVSPTGALVVLQTVDYKIVQTVAVGSNPVSVASDPFESVVYVANRGSGTITVLNGDDLSFIGNLNVPSPPNVVISVQ